MDEKWFYIRKEGQTLYVLTGNNDVLTEEPPARCNPSNQVELATRPNARPHQDSTRQCRPHVDVEDREVFEAVTTDGWSIRLTNQPAQSPDLNARDVGFFDSIQSLQSQTRPRNVEDLIEEVHLGFEATKATTLNKTFVTLQLMIQHIMRRCGGNECRLTYIKKDHLLRERNLPISLPCNSQLYYDTLAAIAPPSLHVPSDLDYLL
ncbi:hypothetical protein F444_16988 [Phytophthora nicotianae P1976]|uniref:Uncharacterized protein n=2 Tax=Phytophthora nicotianae TaxID=4792 RepID=A0A080ZGJ4_PHYNI|nr:hypothetical protein F444_16988 [Phytophthora nicotianae P1976]